MSIKKQKVVMINGCFDLLHVGHIHLLKEAKKLGDILIVGINSDKSKLEYDGKKPIMSENERREILESIKYIDKVYIYNEPHPTKLIEKINPDILVLGNEEKYTIKNRDKTVFIPLLKKDGIKYSTSDIVDTIKNRRKLIAVDFDNTLTIGDTPYWTNEIPIPDKETIEKINKLYIDGNIIIIHSARPWEVVRKTVAWLIENGVRFHGINFNKMAAQLYIDDRSENWSIK